MKFLYKSKRIVTETKIFTGGILVENGKIKKIYSGTQIEIETNVKVVDFNNLVLMSGIIDSHVHVNEPGRTEWEGFLTATKAATFGGVTTIVDMPLNSIPPTTNLKNLKEKIKHAKNKIFVDVGFWGGVIPGNENNLLELVKAGVVGFKCFLCDSGVKEFPSVTKLDVEKALKVLENTSTVLAFHAELFNEKNDLIEEDPKKYDTFLNSRNDEMEINAIQMILEINKNNRVHIVHLSSSKAIPLIADYKYQNPKKLTVETCHHYLSFCSEDIKDNSTHFKCCPPIRNFENRELLWESIKEGLIDLVVSDHSPCTPDLKLLNPNNADFGNFLNAWGGISSLQLGLSIFWTGARQRNFKLNDATRLLSINPSKLCGFDKFKGKIEEGFDADFVVWDPDESFVVKQNMIQHKNKISPYIGKQLYGVVHYTILRGEIIFKDQAIIPKNPTGKLILNL